MNIYIIFIIMMLLLGWGSNLLAYKSGYYKLTKSFFFIYLTIFIIVIIGFRGIEVGIDTKSYLVSFRDVGNTSWKDINWTYMEPGFMFLIKFFSFFVNDPRIINVIFALITTFLIARFYYLMSSNNKGVFLFGWIIYIGFLFPVSITATRQWLALAICLSGIYYYFKDQNKKYIIYTLLATTIHYTAIICFIPFFLKKVSQNKKLTKIVSFCLIMFGAFFEIFTPLFIRVLPSYRQYFDYYVNAEGTASTYVKVAIYLSLIVISMYVNRKKKLTKQECEQNNFCIIIFSFMIMFALIGNRYYQINRLAYYFTALNPILITTLFEKIPFRRIFIFTFSVSMFVLLYYTLIYGTNGVYPYKFCF